MNNQQESLGYEKEFDEQFPSCNGGDAIYSKYNDDGLSTGQYIKSFIKSLLTRQQEQIVGEIIICAAVLTTEGEVIRGHRHSNCIHAIRDMGAVPAPTSEAQGFVTSRNRYVTREEGRKLQDSAGIKSVDPEGYRGKTLFSEDLY